MSERTETSVRVPAGGVELEGELALPEDATGLVVFAHGSGSSRKSPRNGFVADELGERGLGTLLFDLLTEAEDRTYETRFDVELLTTRLLAATEWLRRREETRELPLGYFGSSTGAAAALRADAAVLERNRAALKELTCEKELTVIEGAGHLFEGPGELAEVAARAATWFGRHLS